MDKIKRKYYLNNIFSIQEKNYSIEKKELLKKLQIIKKLTKIFYNYLFSSYKTLTKIEIKNDDIKFVTIKYTINNYLIEISLSFIQDKFYKKGLIFYKFVKNYYIFYLITKKNLLEKITMINKLEYELNGFNIYKIKYYINKNNNNFYLYFKKIENFFDIYENNFNLIIYKNELLY